MAEQVLEKSGAPSCRRRGPGNFQTARDGVCSFARAETVLPTKTLCIESLRFGFRTQNLAAILLFDRPEKAPRFIETHVVRPTVERSETLLAPAPAAATIAGAISFGAMPGHANE